MPQQAVSVEKQGLIETFLPSGRSRNEVELLQTASLAPNVRLSMAGLVFTNAALIVASNLLIMVQERKKEIGILKSVGAKQAEIIQMILCEALLISIIGAGGGFIICRIPDLLNQWTNDVVITAILSSFVLDLLFVALFTVTVSILFGFIPALSMARLTVMEVLSNE